MYGVKGCNDVDLARYRKFCTRRKTPDPQQLPPTQDVLLYHLKRVNYATAIVKRSLVQFPNVPCPDEHGWEFVDGKLEIKWMIRSPLPDDLVEFIYCNCKKSQCANNQCMCFAHKIDCSDLCACVGCENDGEHDEGDEEDDEEIEDEDEYDDYAMAEP